MATLLTLPYSPWSERARFTLSHHGIVHDTVIHEPVVGELAWRWRTGAWARRATVPVFLDGKTKLFDSLDIAKYADRVGTGTKLFPPKHADAIDRWNAASERALASGRRRSLVRILGDEGALEDNLASLAPQSMRRSLLPIARIGVVFMQSKYDADRISDDTIVEELEGLRRALESRAHLLGELTYADIAMASVLQMVEPVSNTYVPIKNSVRRTFRDAELAERFLDLVQWRDALYARYGKAR